MNDEDGRDGRDLDDALPEALARRLAPLREAAPPALPPQLEQTLLAAYRARQPRAPEPVRSAIRRWLPAALLGVSAAAAGVLWLRGAEAPTMPAARAPAPALAPAGGAVAAGRGARGADRGGFRAIGYPAAPPEGGRVARVELTGAVAAYFGWPMTPDLPRARVQADVLYGADGSAHAVRFLPATFRSEPIPEEEP
jgi:hypothetical protein